MKRIIGLPADGPELSDPISGHFGHCNYFVGVAIEEDDVMSVAFSLRNDGHSSCMEPVLNMKKQEVTDMIVGGIGGRPFMGFIQLGINLFQGVEGTIRKNIELLVKGKLNSLGAPSCGAHSTEAHTDGACQH